MRRYRGSFRTTKGGITLSGGEVLMQPAFAKRILLGAKEMGMHTCIDTSGFLGANCDDEMLDAIDLVLLGRQERRRGDLQEGDGPLPGSRRSPSATAWRPRGSTPVSGSVSSWFRV